jgi:hypothetical protein
MLAGAHRVLQIITHRHRTAEQPETIGRLPSMRRRRAWARSVHRLLEAVSRGDERRPISAAALRQLKTFLCDPSVSLLFGHDPVVARRAARQLQCSFTGHPES